MRLNPSAIVSNKLNDLSFRLFPLLVSFQEFLAVFREEERRLAHEVVSMKSTSMDESETKLMGLDAVIPGGKHEKANSN